MFFILYYVMMDDGTLQSAVDIINNICTLRILVSSSVIAASHNM